MIVYKDMYANRYFMKLTKTQSNTILFHTAVVYCTIDFEFVEYSLYTQWNMIWI